MSCCNDFINYGCFSLCDTTVSNASITAPANGTFTLRQVGSGYLRTQTATGVTGQPLVWNNNFPAGVSHFKILNPAGESIGCFYIEMLREIEECPDLITPIKTVSPC